MFFNRHACRFLLAGPQAGEVNHIRISDDIHRSTFRRFKITRVYRRHVALPPGPLEARKRATKRRLVGLSSLENAATAGENASQARVNSWLFGTKRAAPHSYQWQEPSLPRVNTIKPTEDKGTHLSYYYSSSLLTGDIEPLDLPPWLSDQNLICDPHPLPYSETASLSITKAPMKKKAERRKNQPIATHLTSAEVEDCELFEGLQEPLGRSVAQLQRNPSAFRRLLEFGTPMNTVLEYFKGPILNAEEVENLKHLLACQIQKRSPENDEDKTLSNWIQSQIVQGTLPFQHIAPLLEVVKELDNDTQGAFSTETFYARVVKSVQRCKKRGLQSAKASLLNTVLVIISHANMSPGLESLGWRIVNIMSASCRGHKDEGIGVFVSNAILAKRLNRNPASSLLSSLEGIARALRLFQRLPDRVGNALVESVSKALVSQIQASNQIVVGSDSGIPTRRKTLLEQLSIWWSSLQEHGLLSQLQQQPSWQDLEHVIGSGGPDLVATYLRPMDQKSRCLFLIRHCYQIQSPSESKLEYSQPADLRAILEAQFRDICEEHPDRSPFVNLLLTVRLGKVRGVHSNAVEKFFDIIQSLGLSGTTLTLIRNSNISHVRLATGLVIERINSYIEQGQPRIAYRFFQLFPHLSLEKVPALAEVIIKNQDLLPNAALYYRHTRQKRLIQAKPLRTHTNYLVQVRTQLLNSMAYAYSRSPHLPSISYRKVHKCYLALKAERLPITADITNALSYAGIVRYLQVGKWVSPVQYDFIRSLVSEVEGQQVADRLDELVDFWRGKVLDGNLCRSREDQSLGSLRSSTLNEEQKMKEQKPPNEVPPKIGKDRLHWYKPHSTLQCDSQTADDGKPPRPSSISLYYEANESRTVEP